MSARLDPRHKALFAASASPEAIAEHIETARKDLRRLTRHLAWLEELHARRTGEREAGTWPVVQAAADPTA